MAPAGIGIATILFELTDNGVDRVDFVINLTSKVRVLWFWLPLLSLNPKVSLTIIIASVDVQYIRMMEANGIQKWLFDELTMSNKRAFTNYVPTDDPLSRAQGLARRLLVI